jgi:hypothetical protein
MRLQKILSGLSLAAVVVGHFGDRVNLKYYVNKFNQDLLLSMGH